MATQGSGLANGRRTSTDPGVVKWFDIHLPKSFLPLIENPHRTCPKWGLLKPIQLYKRPFICLILSEKGSIIYLYLLTSHIVGSPVIVKRSNF